MRKFGFTAIFFVAQSSWRAPFRLVFFIIAMGTLAFSMSGLRAADSLPAEYTDAEFWRMVNDFSEPNGAYDYENFVSNEISYQNVIPELQRVTRPGGVFLGVGPEQNFTYVAALKPKMAFVIDIRRQNMIVHLMYKALFEISPDRAEFVSRLFSRKKPAGLGATSSVDAILQAFESAPSDPQLNAETLRAIKDRLIKQRQFKPVGDDEAKLEYVFNVFSRGGPMMDFGFPSGAPNNTLPSYINLLTAGDMQGKKWSYLASEENYTFVRQMQQKNLIVPLVGDFSGTKTLKAIAQHLKDRGALVSVFYISNVEDYIEPRWSTYVANVNALPQDDSSVLLRFRTLQNTQLMWMRDIPLKWPGVQGWNR
jgi:hypothetical protein